MSCDDAGGQQEQRADGQLASSLDDAGVLQAITVSG